MDNDIGEYCKTNIVIATRNNSLKQLLENNINNKILKLLTI